MKSGLKLILLGSILSSGVYAQYNGTSTLNIGYDGSITVGGISAGAIGDANVNVGGINVGGSKLNSSSSDYDGYNAGYDDGYAAGYDVGYDIFSDLEKDRVLSDATVRVVSVKKGKLKDKAINLYAYKRDENPEVKLKVTITNKVLENATLETRLMSFKANEEIIKPRNEEIDLSDFSKSEHGSLSLYLSNEIIFDLYEVDYKLKNDHILSKSYDTEILAKKLYESKTKCVDIGLKNKSLETEIKLEVCLK